MCEDGYSSIAGFGGGGTFSTCRYDRNILKNTGLSSGRFFQGRGRGRVAGLVLESRVVEWSVSKCGEFTFADDRDEY